MPRNRVRLGVNIDHVATLRQARRGRFPDPVEAALICEQAGADSIVCHLREDRRHIQESDVVALRKKLRIGLNLEMSVAPAIVAIALRIKPDQVTLVPERRQELTTEGGLDVARQRKRLKPVVRAFEKAGIVVSLFVDPQSKQFEASRDVGARMIELHTGAYAEASSASKQARDLRLLAQAAKKANQMGLAVAAGHGLDYENTAALVRILEIEEANIGFSIIGRALAIGLPKAVAEMRQLLTRKGASK